MSMVIFVCMVNPVLLGLICALLNHFAHVGYKPLLIGATVSIVIGLAGLLGAFEVRREQK